jgi:PAS domain S-box-containing protein
MNTEPHPAQYATAGLQILHLEDSPADCELIKQATMAARLECHFTYAASQREFTDALNRQRFDLILADYNLPGYDGAAALADARAQQPATPFIFVSGTIGEERAIEIMKEGATDYVLKNRLSRLEPSIRRAVQEAREKSRRLAAEAALHESEERLREMADNIREVFWVRTADGFSVIYASAASEQIWGNSPAWLRAHPQGWLDAVMPEDKAALLLALMQLGQGTPYTLEYRLTRPDGTVCWIEERAFPVRGELGTVERVVAASIDITERKELAEQLKQSQKMEAIGQLAGGIAHDFSNMLSVINGYSGLLLDKKDLPQEVSAWLRQIYVAGGRAASLTRQLLIFSRKAQPHIRTVDLNEIITELTSMLGRLIGERITLQLDLAQQLPPALADSGMIEQVLMNLVVNARDAMPHTGAIVVSTGSCEVTAAECARNPDAHPGAFVWLAVRDTGTGIPPETLARIFEPFFTTKEAGRGTGLGLSTVLGIARQHGGWVEVESEVGTGTLFRVFLPLAAEPPAMGPGSVASMVTAGGKETILLVEDEDSVRDYARTVLEMHGYRVLQAASGIEAVEVWKWHGERVALLLTDLVMPDEMSGLALAEKLQAERPELKVLFTSGYSADMAAEMLAARKGYSFLQKPYQPKTVARMVREVLDGATILSSSQTPFA